MQQGVISQMEIPSVVWSEEEKVIGEEIVTTCDKILEVGQILTTCESPADAYKQQVLKAYGDFFKLLEERLKNETQENVRWLNRALMGTLALSNIPFVWDVDARIVPQDLLWFIVDCLNNDKTVDTYNSEFLKLKDKELKMIQGWIKVLQQPRKVQSGEKWTFEPVATLFPVEGDEQEEEFIQHMTAVIDEFELVATYLFESEDKEVAKQLVSQLIHFVEKMKIPRVTSSDHQLFHAAMDKFIARGIARDIARGNVSRTSDFRKVQSAYFEPALQAYLVDTDDSDSQSGWSDYHGFWSSDDDLDRDHVPTCRWAGEPDNEEEEFHPIEPSASRRRVQSGDESPEWMKRLFQRPIFEPSSDHARTELLRVQQEAELARRKVYIFSKLQDLMALTEGDPDLMQFVYLEVLDYCNAEKADLDPQIQVGPSRAQFSAFPRLQESRKRSHDDVRRVQSGELSPEEMSRLGQYRGLVAQTKDDSLTPYKLSSEDLQKSMFGMGPITPADIEAAETEEFEEQYRERKVQMMEDNGVEMTDPTEQKKPSPPQKKRGFIDDPLGVKTAVDELKGVAGEAQDGVKEAVKDFKETVASLQEKGIKHTVDVSGLIEAMKTALTSLKDKVGVQDTSAIEIAENIVGILSAIWAAYRTDHADVRIAIFAVVLSLTHTVSKLTDQLKHIFGLVEYLKGWMTRREAQVGEDNHVPPEAVKHTENCFWGMVSAVKHFFGRTDPHTAALDQKRIKNFTSYLTLVKTSKDVWSFFYKMFVDAFLWVYEAIFGVPYFPEEVRAVAEKISDYMEEAASTLKMDITHNVMYTPALYVQVEALFDLGVELEKLILQHESLKRNFTSFFSLHREIRVLMTQIQWIRREERVRPMPTMIHFFGNSGIGKTELCRVTAAFYERYNGRTFTNRSIYPYLPENEYHDGYSHQHVVLMDDSYQIDSAEAAQPVSMFIINAKNHSPYQLHMSKVDDKSSVFFDSELILLTGNFPILPRKLGVRDINAVRRRRDLVYFVAPKKLVDEGKVKFEKVDLMETYYKPGEEVDPNQWRFFPTDRFTDKIDTSKMMTFDEVMEEMITISIAHKDDKANIHKTLIEDQDFFKDSIEKLKKKVGKRTVQCGNKGCPRPEDCKCISKEEMEGRMKEPLSDDAYQSMVDHWHSVYKKKKDPVQLPIEVSKMDPIEPKKGVAAAVQNMWKRLGELRDQFTSFMTKWTSALVKSKTIRLVIGLLTVGATLGGIYYFASRSDDGDASRFNESYLGWIREKTNPARYKNKNVPVREAPRWVQVGEDDIDLMRKESRRTVQSMGDLKQFLSDVLAPNTCVIAARTKKGTIATVKATFVAGKYFKTVGHFFKKFAKGGPYTFFMFDGKIYEATEQDLCIVYAEKHDMVLGSLELKTFEPRRNILKHYMTEDDAKLDLGRFVTRVSCERGVISFTTGVRPYWDFNTDYSYDDDGGTYEVTDSLICIGQSNNGDCGDEYAVNNTKWVRKLIATHQSGDNGRMYGIMTTQETLQAGIKAVIAKAIRTRKVQVAEITGYEHLKPVDVKSLPKVTLKPFDASLAAFVVEPEEWVGGVKLLGIADPGAPDRQNSKIQKSPLYGLFGTPDEAPMILHPMENEDGTTTDPLVQMVKKVIRKDHDKSDHKLLYAIADALIPGLPLEYNPRVLTLQEAINGIPGSEHLGPIKLNTSRSFPWILIQGLGKGKTSLFWYNTETGELEAIDLLKEMVEKRIDYYINKKGEKPMSWWCDNKKDERVALHKIFDPTTGKFVLDCRLMSTPPLDLLLTARMYFGAFIENLERASWYYWVALGINPHSMDWTLLWRRLNRFGVTKLMMGDFKKFDSSIKLILLAVVYYMIESWYMQASDYSTDDARVREGIFWDTHQAVHILVNVVYQVLFANPSGNLLTTVVNSFAVLLTVVYCIRRRCEELYAQGKITRVPTIQEIIRAVIGAIFGDDHIIAVAAWVVKVFDMHDYRRILKEDFDMDYTGIDKTKDLPVWYEFTEAYFLGRTFLETPGIVFAPLQKPIIYGSLSWVTVGVLDRYQCCDAVCDSAVREFFHYLEDEYDEFCLDLDRKRDSRGLRKLEHPTWEELFSEFLGATKPTALEHLCNHAWQRDLTEEGIEPNPGWGEAAKALAAKAWKFHVRTCHQLASEVVDRRQHPHLYWVATFVAAYLVTSVLITYVVTPLVHIATGQLRMVQASQELAKAPIENPQATELTTTVSFGDNAGKEEPAVASVPKPLSLTNGTDPYEDAGMARFLSRPYLVKTISWTSAQATGDLIDTLSFPDLLFAVNSIAEKLTRFQFFRSPVKFSLRLNGTSFHFGALLITWCPHLRDDGNVAYWQNMYTAANLDSSILSPNTNQVVDIEIPWLAPSKYLNLKDSSAVGQPNNGFIGQAHVWVLAPLRLTGELTTPTLNISVFANFSQPEVSGFALRTNAIADKRKVQSGEQNAKTVAKSMAGSLANTVKTTIKSTVADIGNMSVGSLMGILKTGMGFLMDKPTSAEIITKVFQDSNSGFALMNGADSVEMLAADVENKVANTHDVYLKHRDFNLFEHYKGLPGLLATGEWDGSALAGDRIIVVPVDPMRCHSWTDATHQFFSPTPLANLTSFFHFWTGSIKYSIRFFTSKYISGRCVVKWLPDPTWAAVITNEDFGDTVSHVIDVTGDTVYNFTIPYLQTAAWQERNKFQEACKDDVTLWPGRNGQWILQIINPLTIGDEEAEAVVYFAIWVSGGPDFRVARPRRLDSGYADGTAVPSQMVKKVKSKTDSKKDNNNTGKEETGVGWTPIKRRTVQSGSITIDTNVREMFKDPFPTLIPAVSQVIQDVTMGEVISSWSQLLRRYHVVRSGTLSGAASYEIGVLNSLQPQYYMGVIGQVDDFARANRSFHYRRGSLRNKVYISNTTVDWIMFAMNNTNTEMADSSDDYDGSSGMTWTETKFRSTIEFQLPFYLDFDMICNCHFYDSVSNAWNEMKNVPLGICSIRQKSGSVVAASAFFSWLLSVGDDWSMGWPVTPVVLAVLLEAPKP